MIPGTSEFRVKKLPNPITLGGGDGRSPEPQDSGMKSPGWETLKAQNSGRKILRISIPQWEKLSEPVYAEVEDPWNPESGMRVPKSQHPGVDIKHQNPEIVNTSIEDHRNPGWRTQEAHLPEVDDFKASKSPKPASGDEEPRHSQME